MDSRRDKAHMQEDYESKIKGILENQTLSNRLRDEKHEQAMLDKEKEMQAIIDKLKQ